MVDLITLGEAEKWPDKEAWEKDINAASKAWNGETEPSAGTAEHKLWQARYFRIRAAQLSFRIEHDPYAILLPLGLPQGKLMMDADRLEKEAAQMASVAADENSVPTVSP